MANAVYNVEEIELQDGTAVELKPLNIKHLREFMKKMDSFGTEKDEEKSLDILIDAAVICLKKQLPELAEDKDRIEDSLDMPTVYKILDICGGVKLNDPQLIAAAMEAIGKDSTSQD